MRHARLDLEFSQSRQTLTPLVRSPRQQITVLGHVRKVKNSRDQSNNSVGRAFALQSGDPDLIPSMLYGPLNTEVIPEQSWV